MHRVHNKVSSDVTQLFFKSGEGIWQYTFTFTQQSTHKTKVVARGTHHFKSGVIASAAEQHDCLIEFKLRKIEIPIVRGIVSIAELPLSLISGTTGTSPETPIQLRDPGCA